MPLPCKMTFDLLTFKLKVTCDVGYLYGNFSLPMPLSSRLRPDVRDSQSDIRRQTDVRRASSFNAHTLGAGHNKEKVKHGKTAKVRLSSGISGDSLY